jgi:hypothetical protein
MAAGLVALAVGAAACGGDDGATSSESSSTSGTSVAEAGALDAAASRDESDDSAGVEHTDEPAEGEEVPAEPADESTVDAGLGDCPPAEAVSAVWGQTFELDDESAMTGAIGLVFCPYQEVIAPRTTDQWGLEPIGEFFSITMTAQDTVIDDPMAERVEGLGERAI